MEEYRGYAINPIPSLIGYQIEFIGRGSAHKSLRGFFTDRKTAKQFIDKYLERKEGVDGETSSSSGDKQVQRRTNNRRKPSN